jgi:hypothetical protein
VLNVRRLQLLLATLALIVVACSDAPDTAGTSQPAGSAGNQTSTLPGADGTAVPDTTESTETPEGTTGTTSDRPLAPDFTLELGDGGSFTLSEGEKPVYLVFWAEW